MALTLAQSPAPVSDSMIQKGFIQNGGPHFGLPSVPWLDWLNRLAAVVDQNPVRINTAELTLQQATISPTDLSLGTSPAGLYEVKYYTRITRAATTSSSLTITLGWTESGIALTQAFAAITSNSTTTGVQSGSVFFRSDNLPPLSYQATYASVGATQMQFRLDVMLLQLKGTA